MNFGDFAAALTVALASMAFGALLGWQAGRRYEALRQTLNRMRKRRPLRVSLDYEFAANAFDNSGYRIVRKQEQLH